MGCTLALLHVSDNVDSAQGFYAIAMKVLDIGGKKNVWKEYQLEQEPLGSVGLYDPRWHPRQILRARSDTVYKTYPQDAVDYFVSAVPCCCCAGVTIYQRYLMSCEH